MADGKAYIDEETCIACEACLSVCPQNAIKHSRLTVIPARQELPVAAVSGNLSVRNEPVLERTSWMKPILGFIGVEILPRIMDSLATVLDQRIAAGKNEKSNKQTPLSNGRLARKRQLRRRQRGGFRS